jgi:hypothetical protein
MPSSVLAHASYANDRARAPMIPRERVGDEVNAPRAEQQNEVAEQLADARAEWLRNPHSL